MGLIGKSLSGALALSIVLFAGCKAAPTHEVVGAPIPVVGGKPVSMDDVQKAILRGGTRAGWQVLPEASGRLSARYASGQHSATVSIEHDTKTYSIKYRDSINLRADGGGSIHKVYNRWVQNLDRAIRSELVPLTQ